MFINTCDGSSLQLATVDSVAHLEDLPINVSGDQCLQLCVIILVVVLLLV